ncbi:hypothetical protein JCM33374_g1180 [Metschnikowia sp. JCM 33374]|nr:hypothetical protein JCM33374_g1180 [Metschnikowia sp. JCM 33374]
MSRQTLSRIPRDVQHIFRVYETAAQVYRPYDDKLVSQFVDKTGSYYDTFNRRKLLTESDDGSLCPNVQQQGFPPCHTRYPDTEPLFSDWSRTAKHFSDYQAKILSSFASYYVPLRHASSPGPQKSLKWYQRLLSDTPVVFFLRQKQRLMTESSLRGINQPLDLLKHKLDSIRARYVADPNIDKRIRNYHIADLVTTDIFKLAVESELDGAGKDSAEQNTPLSRDREEDKLCAYLHTLRQPQILGPDFKPCSEKMTGKSRLTSKYPLSKIEAVLDSLENPQKLSDIFPYDIQYNDLYMLTIEEPVAADNHQDVLDLLHKSDHFEVFAARISQAEALQFDIIQEPQPRQDNIPASTYEQLLKWAETQRSPGASNHASRLLERLGEWGLVEVEENISNSAFYVFKETKQ